MSEFQRRQFERLCLQLGKGEVKEVCLSNLRYGPLTEEMLNELLAYSSSIQRLQFNVHLSKSMLLKLASWLGADNNLIYLGLEYCDATVLDFLKAADHLSVDTLQLRFYKNFVLDTESQEIVRDFFANNSLTNLRFGVCEELGLCEVRQQVSLLECLLIGLAGNKSVKALELQLTRGSDLSEDSLEMLFQQNECMQRFSVMAHDQLKEPFVSDFLTALKSSCVPRDIALKSLSREASAALFQGLASATMINSLTSAQFEYRQEDLVVLSDSLAQNSTIRKLSLAAGSGGSHATLAALTSILSRHKTLQSFQLLDYHAESSEDVCHVIEGILESNPHLVEFGFQIYTANDAKALICLIPRLPCHVQSLKIVDGSSSMPLLDSESLLDALEQNLNLSSYDFYSPCSEHNARFTRILQRNVQLRRRRETTKSVPRLGKSPQMWPLVLFEMSNREGWIDTTYHFARELVMLQR